ncbi:hypothetical protein [Leeuwenhoekiella sp. MAR_2009_132]|uniref:hypothetical protein n=1 Tax=Leeuwenhoekiella sp. MAR_2009_132 TaxID=1392489 RepID=UPI000490D6C0|nr:hypothetical protein [Leeuwenhoekiella sp. MAR_2009_132]
MNSTLKKLNILGYYQLIGGIIGLLFTLYILMNQPVLNGPLMVIYLIAIGLMIYTIYCGFLLIKKQYEKGINFSMINQALQVIGFGVLGYGFKYTSGILAGLKVDLTNDFIIGLNFNVTTWKMNWNSDPDLTYININFVAIFILGFIFKAKEKFDNNKSEIELFNNE